MMVKGFAFFKEGKLQARDGSQKCCFTACLTRAKERTPVENGGWVIVDEESIKDVQVFLHRFHIDILVAHIPDDFFKVLLLRILYTNPIDF